ncbi:MAG: dihydrofolate reductase [Geobacteraceae bacterium]|nr:dihydrofolate reductase [Geobacteraceae bacterium]
MRVGLIAAMAQNRVIGNGPEIPWDLPDDRRRFREITWGRPVVMGRRTFETLPGPLPGRMTIVLTRDRGYCRHGCRVVPDLEAALKAAEGAEEVFICGGGEVYRQAMPLADRIYLTVIHRDFHGDVLFPEVPPDFEVTEKVFVPEPVPHTFLVYERKGDN